MLTNSQIEELRLGALVLGIPLDDTALARFSRFAEMLVEANRHFNLTRIAPEDVVALHFLDSLTIGIAPPAAGARLIDVGTGAGFPGMPIALAYPDVRVVLLDATRKRLAFLDTVIADLSLSNVRTIHGRAEDIARMPGMGRSFDMATARAVAKLPELAGWLAPFLKDDGVGVAYKSRDVDSELADAQSALLRHGVQVDRVEEVAIPARDILRKLVMIRRRERDARARTAPSRRSRHE